MPAKVKICGITNEEDATWAVNLGAHFLGFNFYKESHRKVSPELAKRVVGKVPPFVPSIGVFVDHPVPEIVKIVKKVGLMGIQLHGEYTPEDVESLSGQLEVMIIRAFRVATEADVEAMAPFQYRCKYFLMDAKVEGEMGGTGQTFPWELAERAKAFKLPLFLAGGLTPENVEEAIEKTLPFAVDVASGVEKSPKRKDYEKMKAFIEAVKTA